MRIEKLLLIAGLAALTCMAAIPNSAAAQPHIGLNLGYNATNEQAFIGGQAQFHIMERPLLINPRAEAYFIEDQTFLQFDGNLQYSIGEEYTQLFTPYVGGGLGVIYQSLDAIDESNVYLGLNLLSGAVFLPQAMVHPFIDLRLTVAGDSHITAMGGIMITL